jgi:hypothetical protein
MLIYSLRMAKTGVMPLKANQKAGDIKLRTTTITLVPTHKNAEMLI